MKRKLLLTGNNKRLITDFFMQLDFDFDSMSSSMVYSDLKAHYQYFKPAAVVYCMRSENRDDVTSVVKFTQEALKDENVVFIVISDTYDYEFLCKSPNVQVDGQISINLPITDIRDEIKGILIKRANELMEKKEKSNAEETKNTSDILAQLESTMAGLGSGGSASDKKERARILVVDDTTIVHKTIKGYLEKDYDISTAISGEIALRFLKSKKVDLILLDYEMPGMDGAEVLQNIRSMPEIANIPVVFLTGINDGAKIRKILALKPAGYLLKPIQPDLLTNKIKEVLG